ncbi:MAG: histidine triad nucleotide-binding protein [Candidatus Kerfeldbacteria bacterium]|nr:histidine triad nucleotide-binding protein [Candidatus Kerfeldbacteria bacterium]
MKKEEECIFCNIVAKKVDSAIVFENEEMMAFKDIRAKAPVHLLLVPKKHVVDLNAMTEADEGLLGRMMLQLSTIAKEHGIAESGYKVVNNIGNDGGQIIHHFHFHLLGGAPVQSVV